MGVGGCERGKFSIYMGGKICWVLYLREGGEDFITLMRGEGQIFYRFWKNFSPPPLGDIKKDHRPLKISS